LDGPAVDRGVSGGLCPTLLDPRSRFDLRRRFPATSSWYANRRSHHRSPLALAKSLRGTPNRQYPPRMSRPRDCTLRRASSENSKEVFSLLLFLITMLLCSMSFKIRVLSAQHLVPPGACCGLALVIPTLWPLPSRAHNDEIPRAHRLVDVHL